MQITMWHGGRNLESSYKENLSSKAGRCEHGVGLYTTNHYLTAKKYAKGGGKTYQLQIDLNPEQSLEIVSIPIEEALDFISKHIKKKSIPQVSSLINENMKRLKNMEYIKAAHLQNIILNTDSIAFSKTNELCTFFVKHGVQYGLVKYYSGHDENVLVIYDKTIIKKVQSINSHNVSLDSYILDIPPSNHLGFLSEKLENIPTHHVKP